MQKAIIVGASGGLGSALAQQLLAEQVTVINISRTQAPAPIANIAADLARPDDVERAIATVREQHSDADVYIYCAGLLHRRDIGTLPSSEIDSDLAVNLNACIKLSDKIVPMIAHNHGDVVIVGSTSSFNTQNQESSYAAAKFGLRGYVLSLQGRYKDEDVRVIGLYPGGMQSQFHIKAGSGLKQEELMDPKDIATLVMSALHAPRNLQVSELLINRKKRF